jgi:hypothetical protein
LSVEQARQRGVASVGRDRAAFAPQSPLLGGGRPPGGVREQVRAELAALRAEQADRADRFGGGGAPVTRTGGAAGSAGGSYSASFSY